MNSESDYGKLLKTAANEFHCQGVSDPPESCGAAESLCLARLIPPFGGFTGSVPLPAPRCFTHLLGHVDGLSLPSAVSVQESNQVQKIERTIVINGVPSAADEKALFESGTYRCS